MAAVNDRARIDRYEIIDQLGSGAMGAVYRAWDPKLHREVAIKAVFEELSRDPKGRERFHREARAIAALRHPNIVEIYDYSGTDSPRLYLVMERLTGDDIFNIVNDRGTMPEAVAAAIGHELCLALQVAHEAGIIHRDLKPENVFLNDNGRVVLTDFGVVKAVNAESAVDGYGKKTDVIGTPGFMSPELMLNQELGPAADIFAMGALLYNVSTGRLPYDGRGPMEIYRATMAGKFSDPRQYVPTLSEEWCDVLAVALQPKPRRRHESTEAMRQHLKNVLEINGVTNLRDELRDYMRDTPKYVAESRRRVAKYLLSQLKIAVKDRDQDRADQIRHRLLAVDPQNPEIFSITGVLNVNQRVGEPRAVPTDTGLAKAGPKAKRRRKRGGWLSYVAVGALSALAVGVAGYLLLVPREGVDPALATHSAEAPEAAGTAPQAPPVPEPEPAEAAVQVRIRGGVALIFVDGKRVSRGRKYHAMLSVGTHELEVRGKGKRLKETLTVKSDQILTVRVELRRGRIRTSYTEAAKPTQ